MTTTNREYKVQNTRLLDELVEKYNTKYRVCDNCSSGWNAYDDDTVCKKDILFHTYRFCSERCGYDAEYDIRKLYNSLSNEEKQRWITRK